MVSPMFEFLFKYSRATYERAELVFASGWPVWLLVTLAIVAAGAIGVSIWRRRAGLGVGRAIVLGMLQAWAPEALVQTISSFSFLTHFQSIIKGVIDLRDAVFFASVIGVFLLANVVLVDLKKAD